MFVCVCVCVLFCLFLFYFFGGGGRKERAREKPTCFQQSLFGLLMDQHFRKRNGNTLFLYH